VVERLRIEIELLDAVQSEPEVDQRPHIPGKGHRVAGDVDDSPGSPADNLLMKVPVEADPGRVDDDRVDPALLDGSEVCHVPGVEVGVRSVLLCERQTALASLDGDDPLRFDERAERSHPAVEIDDRIADHVCLNIAYKRFQKNFVGLEEHLAGGVQRPVQDGKSDLPAQKTDLLSGSERTDLHQVIPLLQPVGAFDQEIRLLQEGIQFRRQYWTGIDRNQLVAVPSEESGLPASQVDMEARATAVLPGLSHLGGKQVDLIDLPDSGEVLSDDPFFDPNLLGVDCILEIAPAAHSPVWTPLLDPGGARFQDLEELGAAEPALGFNKLNLNQFAGQNGWNEDSPPILRHGEPFTALDHFLNADSHS